MDQSYHMEQGVGDYLHQSRSASVTATQPRLDLLDTAAETSIDSGSTSNTPSSTSVPSLSTNFSSDSEGSPFITCLAPKPYTPHPLSTQTVLDQNWSYLESSKPSQTLVVRVEEPRDSLIVNPEPTPQVNTTTPAFNSQEMSTLGIQFDPQFDAVTRQSYTWPLFDMNEPFENQGAGTLGSFNMSSNMPTYAKSLSSSPPQAIFTPEQRELKRQRDLARRESKSKQRRERSTSNPYSISHNTTPDLLPRSISGFPTTLAPSSIHTESSSTFSSPTFMPALVSQMANSESPELFGQPFPLIPSEFGVGGFLMPFSSCGEHTIPSFTSRPHSHSSASDQPYFYQTSSVATQDSPDTVRVVHSRPKPQCWDHGCNGRQFSTFSNLLRHQREKSGVSSKPFCPKCGAEFTRTTARNGHMAHEKCKQRRNSNH